MEPPMTPRASRALFASSVVLCCLARPVLAQGSERVVDEMMDTFSFVVAALLALGVGVSALAASRGRASPEFLVTLAVLALTILALMAWQLELSVLWPTFLAIGSCLVTPMLSLWSRARRRRRQ